MKAQYPLEIDDQTVPMVHLFSKEYSFPEGTQTRVEMKVSRIVDQISMYMPGSFAENIKNNWTPQSIWGGANNNTLDQVMAEGIEKLSQVMGTKVVGAFTAHTGKAVQPTDMLLFQSVDPINLNFSFNLMPTNEKEAAQIQLIMNLLKESQLPITSDIAGFLNYPRVWDIKFTGVKGLGLIQKNGYSDMALVSCNMNYSHGESFMVFHDEQPVQVTLQLSFMSIRRPMLNSKNIIKQKIDDLYGRTMKILDDQRARQTGGQ